MDRLVDREPGEHGERARRDDQSIGGLLEGVVLALRRVVLAEPQVVELHLDGRGTSRGRNSSERHSPEKAR